MIRDNLVNAGFKREIQTKVFSAYASVLSRLLYRREVEERKRDLCFWKLLPKIFGTIARIESEKGRPITGKELASLIKNINARERESALPGHLPRESD